MVSGQAGSFAWETQVPPVFSSSSTGLNIIQLYKLMQNPACEELDIQMLTTSSQLYKLLMSSWSRGLTDQTTTAAMPAWKQPEHTLLPIQVSSIISSWIKLLTRSCHMTTQIKHYWIRFSIILPPGATHSSLSSVTSSDIHIFNCLMGINCGCHRAIKGRTNRWKLQQCPTESCVWWFRHCLPRPHLDSGSPGRQRSGSTTGQDSTLMMAKPWCAAAVVTVRR